MHRLIQPFRELGFLPGFFYLADRAVERLFGRRIFFYYSMVAQPVVRPRLRPAKDQHTVVCKNWTDIAPYAEQMTATESMIRERFSHDYVCVVLAQRDELLGHGWLSFGNYIEDEVRCLFTPLPEAQTGWDFDVFVLPQHRGTLMFARLWDAINQALSASGRVWSVSRISRFNVTSFQSHKSMGAVRCADVLFVVIGRVQLMISPLRPFLHLSIRPDSYPAQSIDVTRKLNRTSER